MPNFNFGGETTTKPYTMPYSMPETPILETKVLPMVKNEPKYDTDEERYDGEENERRLIASVD
jgi:hypothetical protein